MGGGIASYGMEEGKMRKGGDGDHSSLDQGKKGGVDM